MRVDRIGCVRAERLSVQETHVKSVTILICPAASNGPSLFAQIGENFTSRNAWIIPGWRHLDNLPVEQCGFALHFR
jgi:hypothetical protein